MNSLETAIVSAFSATSGLSDFGGITYGVSDPEHAFPLASFYKISGRLSEGLDPNYNEEFRYQFSLFHTDKDALEGYQDALHDKFDRVPLTLTGNGRFTSCQRINDFVMPDAPLPQGGQQVWHAVSEYRIRVDRTFGNS